jgi:hypothetical protein
MKLLAAYLIALTVGMNAHAGGLGYFCDPAHHREIPPLTETECSAHLYDIFPKILEYKGQIWGPSGPFCSYNGRASQSDLGVTYCKSGHLREMSDTGLLLGQNLNFKMDILDLEGPEYQSVINKKLLKITLMVFDVNMLSPMMHLYKSNNQDFDKDMARISMPSGRGDAYVFSALKNKRYLVKIVIYGIGRFKEPKDVDAFVAEYTKQMRFK